MAPNSIEQSKVKIVDGKILRHKAARAAQESLSERGWARRTLRRISEVAGDAEAKPSPVPHKYSCVWEGEEHKQIRFASTIQKATAIWNQLKPLVILWQFPEETGRPLCQECKPSSLYNGLTKQMGRTVTRKGWFPQFEGLPQCPQYRLTLIEYCYVPDFMLSTTYELLHLILSKTQGWVLDTTAISILQISKML